MKKENQRCSFREWLEQMTSPRKGAVKFEFRSIAALAQKMWGETPLDTPVEVCRTTEVWGVGADFGREYVWYIKTPDAVALALPNAGWEEHQKMRGWKTKKGLTIVSRV